VGSQVVRNGKTYYKDDSGALHADYRAAVMHSLPEARLGRVIESAYRGLGGDAMVRQGIKATGDQLWQSMGITPPATAAPAPAPARARPRVDAPERQPEPATQQVAPGLGRPAPHVAPAERARDSNLTAMAQQYAPQDYWQSQTGAALAEAAKTGPKAGTAGYAQRADIQAWIAANQNAPKGADGKNIVDRFLDQQRKRGLLDAPGEAGTALAAGAERIAMPTDAASAAQAGTKGLVGYDGTALQQAQAGVAEIQRRENSALTQRIFQQAADGTLVSALPESLQPQVDLGVNWAQTAKAAITPAVGAEMEIAEPFSSPELNRQYASLGQPAAAQAVATGTGSGPNLQPTSAAAGEAGVEPSQPDAPGNKPNPADELARRYVDGLRTRTARLGY
jgi:hypothetical protein